jgi:mRNA-degrading endonuclease RelE of RelBE toxin-antitoxin system
MTWTVTVKKKAEKQFRKLPVGVTKSLIRLLREIELYGPYRNNWQSYGSLGKNRFHCHLKKGTSDLRGRLGNKRQRNPFD